jgi:hypothetical protein
MSGQSQQSTKCYSVRASAFGSSHIAACDPELEDVPLQNLWILYCGGELIRNSGEEDEVASRKE